MQAGDTFRFTIDTEQKAIVTLEKMQRVMAHAQETLDAIPDACGVWSGGCCWNTERNYLVCVCCMLVTGCATFDQRAGFSDVSTTVEARSGKRVVWNLGTELDAQVAEEVHALLQDTLTADGAVQVALLNNRELQAIYAELGVAQADLVQAGLLSNPVFDGAAFFPVAGGPVKLDLSVAMSFLDIFYIPLRTRVAAARFEDAKTAGDRCGARLCRHGPGRVLSPPGQRAAA